MNKSNYFGHNFNAYRDDKLVPVLKKHNWFGYGVYWGIIEQLHEQNGFISKATAIDFLSYNMRIDEKKLSELVDYFISIGLLCYENDFLTSKRVQKNLLDIDARIERAKNNGQKGGIAKAKNTKNVATANPDSTKNVATANQTSTASVAKQEKQEKQEIQYKQEKQTSKSKEENCLLVFSDFSFECKDKNISLTEIEFQSLKNEFPDYDIKKYLMKYSEYLETNEKAKKPLSKNLFSVIHKNIKSRFEENKSEETKEENPYGHLTHWK